LAAQLRIELRRVGSGARLTFDDGEDALSAWLERNAFVTWVVNSEPWVLEKQIIQHVSLPLNLDHNQYHRFAPRLVEVRRLAKARARELPVLGHR
jgi:hypothetical protein